jgi:hypothetical protein
LDAEQVEDLRAMVAEMSPGLRELAVAWPPDARVMAREGVELLSPAPGIVGVVHAYYEDGTLGITARLQRTVGPSPHTGAVLHAGQDFTGKCHPDQLELLEEGLVTADDVRAAIESI